MAWAEATVLTNGDLLLASGCPEQAELGRGSDPIVQADLLDDLAVLELENGRASEVHLPARIRGQASGEKVLERRAGVCATALPLPDDVIAFGDEIGRAPEVQIGEGRAKVGHESLDVIAALPRVMQ